MNSSARTTAVSYTHLNPLAQRFQTQPPFFDDRFAQVKGDGQAVVLVGGVDLGADDEEDVVCLLYTSL